MGWFLAVLLLQCVIAVVVIIVLKYLLDRELVEAAMEKLYTRARGNSDSVEVISATPLNEKVCGRIKDLITRKSPDTKVTFIQDVAIKGGIIIRFHDEEINFSLEDRLKNIWS